MCSYLSLFLLYIDIKIGKIVVKCYTSRWPPVWEISVDLAVAGGVFDGVFFVLSFFPLGVLDEIWDLTESVSEGFPTYFALKWLQIIVSYRFSMVNSTTTKCPL